MIGDLHLGQDIAHDSSVVVLRHIEQLWPRQNVIEVVLQLQQSREPLTKIQSMSLACLKNQHALSTMYLQLVVLGQAQQVAPLHGEQVLHDSWPYADHPSQVSSQPGFRASI